MSLCHNDPPSTDGTLNTKKAEGVSSSLAVSDNEERGEEEYYPEGGFRGWAAVIGAVLIQFCGFGYCTAFGVFQDYYTHIYLTESSPSAISWIGSVNAFLSIAGSIFAGVLYDKGYFRYLLYGGSFMVSFSLFMLSLAQPNQYYQVFLTHGILFGLGAGLTHLPSVAIVSHYFKLRLSLAMILVASGSSLGAVVHPILLSRLLNGVGGVKMGFGGSVRASAGMVAGLLGVACLLIKERHGVSVVNGGSKRRWRDVWGIILKSGRDAPYVCVCLSLAVFAIGFYYPIFYLQLDAVENNVDDGFSFYIYTYMNTACLVGGLLPALFVDYVGVTAILVVSSAATAVSVFAMLGLKDLASAAAITVVYGLWIGMFFGVLAPMIAQLTMDKCELGTRLGLGFTFTSIGALAGPPIHGALLESSDGRYIWWKPAVFGGLFAGAGALGFAMVPVLVARRQRGRGV